MIERCKACSGYWIDWIEHNCKKRDKDGKLKPFKLTPMQKKLLEIIKQNNFKLPPVLKWRIR